MLLWRYRGPRVAPLTLALVYFVVSLFPVLGFLDVFFFRYSFVGDHFQYLASMGPLALIGAGLALAVQRYFPADDLTRVVVFGSPLVVLGGLTALQSRMYQTNFALWEDTAARNPEAWIARVNYGAELRLAGRSAEALEQLQAAVRLKPEFVEVEMNVGASLIDLGRAAEAVPHFERALTGKYMQAEIRNGLGAAFLQLGRLDEAIAQFEQALALKPELSSAQSNLSAALLRANRTGEAIERASFYAANGRRSCVSRPPPGLLDRLISPPAARAMLRAMVRPSPSPPVWRLRDCSRRTKEPNTASIWACGMPGPSSRMVSRIMLSDRRRLRCAFLP